MDGKLTIADLDQTPEVLGLLAAVQEELSGIVCWMMEQSAIYGAVSIPSVDEDATG